MRVKSGLAEMLKGGVIMDVVDAEQARIAEDAGACVMALERVPADIRVHSGRGAHVRSREDPRDPGRGVDPVMAMPHRPLRRGADPRGARGRLHRRVRGAPPADTAPRRQVAVHRPVRLRRDEPRRGASPHRRGAAMIRTKEAGTGDIVNAVTHMRAVFGGMRRLQSLREEALLGGEGASRPGRAGALGRGARTVAGRHVHGGWDRHPRRRRGALHAARRGRRLRRRRDLQVGRLGGAKAIVEATTHFRDAKILAEVSAGLGEPMVGISSSSLLEADRLEVRGW